MRLNEMQFNDADPIEGYGPGFFRIGGTVWSGAVLTGPRGTSAWVRGGRQPLQQWNTDNARVVKMDPLERLVNLSFHAVIFSWHDQLDACL